MTMPQNKETFQWDDHLVKEYLRLVTSVEGDAYWQSELDKFKRSKQPKPKDWRILSFKRIKGNQAQTFDLKESTGYYVDSLTGYEIHTEEEMLHRGCCVDSGFFAIQSVKRLSDGEVFTIGDTVNIELREDTSPKHIERFEINHFDAERILAWHSYAGRGIETLQKAKPVLFTTHDGVAIREGDEYYFVVIGNYSLCVLGKDRAIANEALLENKKTFSTREEADKYMLFHKPLLSLEDLLSVWDGDLSTRMRVFNMKHPSFIRMMELAKTKL